MKTNFKQILIPPNKINIINIHFSNYAFKINFDPNSLPSYIMQTNWLPQNICDSIDQITRNFIWRGTDNKGIHLVNWKKSLSSQKNSVVWVSEQLEKLILVFLVNLFGTWSSRLINYGCLFFLTNTQVATTLFMPVLAAIAPQLGLLSSVLKTSLRTDTLGALVRAPHPFGSATGTLLALQVIMFLLLMSMTFNYLLEMFFPLLETMHRFFTLLSHQLSRITSTTFMPNLTTTQRTL